MLVLFLGLLREDKMNQIMDPIKLFDKLDMGH